MKLSVIIILTNILAIFIDSVFVEIPIKEQIFSRFAALIYFVTNL
jgi:hypothetical protein